MCSVIICTKDRSDEISRCVDSLLEQTIEEFELIVVDASADRNTEVLLADRLEKVKNRISFKYIKSPGWLTRQRNIGVKNSSEEILVFLDDDVVLEKDYLESYLRIYEKDIDKHIAGVGGVFLDIRPYNLPKQLFHKLFLLPTADKKQRMLPSSFATHIINPSGITKVEILNGGNTSYRKCIFDSFRFDENFKGYGYMEDDDFSYRVSRTHELYVAPAVKSKHFVSDKSRDDLEYRICLEVKNHYYFFRKNMEQNIKTWLAFIWSEIGQLLKYLLEGNISAFAFRCKGYKQDIS